LPRLPRLTASEAEKLLLGSGFALVRTQGSHHIYRKGNLRVVIPFHAGKTLHPKIIKEVLRAVDEQ
jgi:predicted RNA binding protein YcfA (HicA-like mRNA interferase family)